MNCFISRAKTALWFAEAFGLDISSINVTERDTGIAHSVSVTETNNTNTASEQHHTYDSLLDNDKENQILFLLDKFYVSDDFYHEVTMLVDDLPRSYLIKQRRKQLNQLCSISRTPGKFDGCQVDLKDSLTKSLEEFVSENPDFDFENNPVRIKLSGDGAQMTRNTNFVILSHSLLDSKKNNPMSAKGNHSLAVVKGSEDYNTLKESFGKVFNHINNLNLVIQIKVGDKNINLELYFGGDYKFLLIVFGLQNATCNYSCLWCKNQKDQRWDMSHDVNYYYKR